MNAPAKNVYQRIAEMKKMVASATFSKVKGEGLKFSYLPVDQMKPIVEEAMNAAGLYLSRGPIEYEDAREPWDSNNGYSTARWFHYKGRRTFQWINIDDPSDRSELQTYDGEAKDNSDKTLNKLSTAILKAFYKEEFNISESPKDDTDNTEDEIKAEKAAQQKKISQQAKKDPFFAGAPKVEIPAPKPKPTDITADRPRETMVDTIIKATNDLRLRSIVKKAIQEADASEADTDQWTDDQVKHIYKAVVKAGRDAE